VRSCVSSNETIALIERACSMKRISILMIPATALAVLGMPREALAGGTACGSPTSAYSQECFFGNSSAANTAEFISDNAIAVLAGDKGCGSGVIGTSDTQIGVVGVAGLSSPGAPSIQNSCGTVVAGVFGTNAPGTLPTFGANVGVFGWGASLTGVKGESSGGAPNAGVFGQNQESGYGVYGNSAIGDGVHGVSDGSSSSGVAGVNNGAGVGVYGASSTGWAVESHGNLDIANSGSLYLNGACDLGPCTSDERLKKDIQPLKNALSKVLQLKGVTYEWRDPTAIGNAPGTQTGFIAQDVEKAFPQWMGENRDGYKTINLPPREIAALMVEAFREQQQEIDELKAARRPVISMNANGLGIGVAGIAIAGEGRQCKADPVAKRNPRISRAKRLSRTVGYVTDRGPS
jgi:Chaperone of endosialidase